MESDDQDTEEDADLVAAATRLQAVQRGRRARSSSISLRKESLAQRVNSVLKGPQEEEEVAGGAAGGALDADAPFFEDTCCELAEVCAGAISARCGRQFTRALATRRAAVWLTRGGEGHTPPGARAQRRRSRRCATCTAR